MIGLFPSDTGFHRLFCLILARLAGSGLSLVRRGSRRRIRPVGRRSLRSSGGGRIPLVRTGGGARGRCVRLWRCLSEGYTQERH
jgi:hypothetical protein